MMFPLVHGVFGSYQEGVFEVGRYRYVAGGNTHAVAIKKDNSVVTWGSGKSTPPVVADAKKIAAGISHDCVLREDGTVQCWGNNSYGQTSVPASLGQVLDIACCKHTTAALKTDGTVVVWGRNNAGQFNVPSEVDGFAVAIAGHAGGQHFVALLGNGDVYCWGDNSYGQAANQIGYGANAITSGGNFNYLHQSNGALRSWGVNNNGQRNTPNDLLPIIAIACGDSHTMALQNDGTVRCWGYSYYGQTTVPSGLADVVAIGAAYNQSYAIKSDCSLVGWGDGYNSMLSIPSGLYKIPGSYTPTTPPAIPAEPDPNVLTPGIATTANTYKRVFCGSDRAIAIGCNSTIFTWGKSNNQSGTPPTGGSYSKVVGGEKNFSLCIDDGDPKAWGYKPNQSFIYSPPTTLPYVAPDLSGVLDAASDMVAAVYSYYLKADGTIASVFYNGDDIAGAGTDYHAPAGTFTSLASGAYGAAGIKADGTIAAWGTDFFGSTEAPSLASAAVEIAGGSAFYIVLCADGSIVHWGTTAYGTDQIPEFESPVVSIASGFYHCLAVLANGRVIGWGQNSYGQATPPSSLNNAVRAFAGEDYSIAVMSDGKLTGWGKNNLGQAVGHQNRSIICNDGPPDNSPVTVGGQYLAPINYQWGFLVLSYEGRVKGWEDGSTGIFPIPLNLPPASAVAAFLNSSGKGYGVIIDGNGKLRTWGNDSSVSAHPYKYGSAYPSAKAAAICKNIYWGLNVLSIEGVPYVSGTDNNRPPSMPTMVAFETGYSFKIALSSGGVVYAWGNGKRGGLSVPEESSRVMEDQYNGYVTGLTNVVQISLLYELCVALKADGSVYVWGYDYGAGALSVPSGLPTIAQVACGLKHVVALGDNGLVYCWGDNSNGECDVPSDLGLVESVFAVDSSSYAVLRDGTVRRWGHTYYVPPGLNLND